MKHLAHLFLVSVVIAFKAHSLPLSFDHTSYQTIIDGNKSDSFIMLLWSLDCAPCIEELPMLSEFHKHHPEVKIIMVSTDEQTRSSELLELMRMNKLSDIHHWMFEIQASQRIRYSIDPGWYGELPRSYFYSSGKRVDAISGKLNKSDLYRWLAIQTDSSNIN